MKQTETSGPVTSKVNKVERYQWNKLGKPGEFLWLDKGELFIDHTYQRDKVHNERVLAISSNWDWVMCGAISVAIREDKWYVMDGQHRVLAANKRSDIKKLPCMVFDLNDMQKEAAAFVGLNSQKTAVTGIDRFKAMIVAGDKIAISIQELLTSTGHRVSAGKANKNVSCIMLVWRLYKKNPEVLNKIWPLISDASIGTQPVDSFIRGTFFTEIKANAKGFSLTDQNVRQAVIAGGCQVITAEIRRECGIAGKGGERIETAAFVKWLNRQRLGSKFKIDI